MIKGIVKLDTTPLKDVSVFESTENGVPLKRNGVFVTTRTNNKGEYSINIPKGDNYYVTFRYVGTDGAVLNTKKVPLILILTSNQTLPEVEVEGKMDVSVKKIIDTSKKFNRYWLLLLLIPIIYKLSKKK